MPKTKTLKHHERINHSLLKILIFLSFLLGVSASFVLYLESDYFKTATGSENITYFFIIANVLALILIFNWHYLVSVLGKANTFLANTFLKALAILLLVFLPVSEAGAWVLVSYIVLAALSWVSLDILIEAYSKDAVTGRIRGLYLTAENTGRLISPAAAGFLVCYYGFQSAFLAVFSILVVVEIIAFLKLRKLKDCLIEKESFFSMMRMVIKRKNVMKIYYISFLLDFFYALMIIYTPLYLLGLGFSWAEIGKIFTIMLVPFIILQYPAGVLADKKFEEKNMIPFALIIMAVFTISIFFISSNNFYLWAAVLFGTRVGASLIEILRDSYFYKRIDQRDVNVIDFFRSVRPIGYILGLLIAAPIVYFFHIKLIFPIIGIVMLTGVPVSLRMASSRKLPGIQFKIQSSK